MATVHSLPVEILLDIFHKVSVDVQRPYLANLGASPTSTERNYPYSWIRITHASRVWRAVALSSSTLWSTVIFIHPVATEELLQRAGSQLLTIVLDVCGTISPEIVDERLTMFEWLIAEKTSQIKALMMPGFPGYLTRDFAAKATNLRALTLSNPFFEDRAQLGTRLPFPALEHLSITAVPRIPILGLLVTTLKTLILMPRWDGFGTTRRGAIPVAPSIIEIISALYDMPHLEKLHIEVDEEVVETDRVARLPQLKELRLDGPSTSAAYLFRHLEVPPNVTLVFNHKFGEMEDATVVSVVNVIRLSISDPARVEIDHTRFHPIVSCSFSWEQDTGDYVIRGWRASEAQEGAPRSLEERLGPAEVEIQVAMFEPFLVLQTFLAPFCFSGVQELEMGPLPKRMQDIEECCEALASGGDLGSLTLSDLDGTRALKILSGTTANNIVLKRVTFGAGNESQGPTSSSFASKLADIFKSRINRGIPVRQLKILNSSNVPSEGVSALQAVVADVLRDSL